VHDADFEDVRWLGEYLKKRTEGDRAKLTSVVLQR